MLGLETMSDLKNHCEETGDTELKGHLDRFVEVYHKDLEAKASRPVEADTSSKYSSMPISMIHGVNDVSVDALLDMKIRTVGQLQSYLKKETPNEKRWLRSVVVDPASFKALYNALEVMKLDL